MNKEVLLQNGIDYIEGVARFAGQAEIYERFLKKFPEDPTFFNMLSALKNKNYEEAFIFAHTLKGLTGNLSLNTFFSDYLTPFVELLRAPADVDAVNSSLDELKRQYEKTVFAIKSAV